MTLHLSVVEAAWLALSPPALYYLFRLWRLAEARWQALIARDARRGYTDTAQTIAAWMGVRRKRVFLSCEAAFTTAGIVAAFTPPSPRPAGRDALGGFVTLALFFAVRCALLYLARSQWRDSLRLADAIKAERRHKHRKGAARGQPKRSG